jgi:serine/threonine-protein kinase PknG
MNSCVRPGCGGAIEDGFCDLCGLAPTEGAVSTRSDSASSRSGRSVRSRRGRLGAGLVEVPPVPYRDPLAAIMATPEVAEHKRFCGRCGVPVGRGRSRVASRAEGFCPRCGTAFSFTPKLSAGDLVAGQYEVLGCLAHGGLGWVYLARDRNVSDRWVVLKGLLNTGDGDAMAAAMAERRFLATAPHPTIVKIHNFVEHPNPSTGEMVGYIVMEYVGGTSLKQLRVDGGPLPLSEALAYIIEVLPALGYLHSLGLLYCDFKPDNVIQTEEQLKLIDLGAVRRMDDQDGASYKTDGYCAPELETDDVSIASDLFTVGRTLAVLTVDFDFTSACRYRLPDAVDVPLFVAHDSFRRLLHRATAEEPAARFSSAEEMADQATGVLREVLAAEDGVPRPALSTVFSAEREVFCGDPDDGAARMTPALVAAALPVPLVDPTDPAAAFLATSSVTEPIRLAAMLRAARLSTVETVLALARAKIGAGDLAGADADLVALARTEDADWRITWHRGLAAFAGGYLEHARTMFDATYDRFPGEAAPKLALAACAEYLDEPRQAARLYDRVWRTDHAYVSAAFGLARACVRLDDRLGAVAVAESVPPTSSHYTAARLAAIRARLDGAAQVGPKVAQRIVAAGEALASLELDAERRLRVGIEVLGAAHAWASMNDPEGGMVLGYPLHERDLRRGLERYYRELARLMRDKRNRVQCVEFANSVRPVTWV